MSASEPVAREARVQLPRRPECAAIARDVVDRRLSGYVDADALVGALLVVSELVTNALAHGEGAIEVGVGLGPGHVRLEVADQGRGGAAAIRARGEGAGYGWGLHVVDTVAEDWGVEEGPTRVWVQVARAGED